ncbi:Ulp1 family isopeptidase [Candidatus Protochlamydia phocaeensis]|uniref:Ulp1 family isopeptidase n=1 Tax=Candidatus Protochlamydia phocaeensis TaxID=1414722 RepID=UPI000837B3C5|nr:Ulp1 family isopeptidase [Candidatus Protochlamydia phocaeensis]
MINFHNNLGSLLSYPYSFSNLAVSCAPSSTCSVSLALMDPKTLKNLTLSAQQETYQDIYRPLPAFLEVVRLVASYVLSFFNQMVKEKSEDPLTSTTLATESQMECYRRHFNQENPSVYFFPCFNSIIEASLNSSLSLPIFADKPQNSVIGKIMEELIIYENEGWKLQIPEGISLLVLPFNLSYNHWTSIQVNLKTKQIYFLDSNGPGNRFRQTLHPRTQQLVNYYELIWQELEGVKALMEQATQEAFHFYHPGLQGSAPSSSQRLSLSPSIIKGRQQYDKWNCGMFTFHYAWLVSQQDEVCPNFLNQQKFSPIQAHILSRRNHFIRVLRYFGFRE